MEGLVRKRRRILRRFKGRRLLTEANVICRQRRFFRGNEFCQIDISIARSLHLQ